MKNFYLLAATVCLSIIAHSQLRVAIAVGPQQSSIIEENNLAGWDSLQNNFSKRTGFHLGFIADLQLKKGSSLYFQPGVMFYNKGRKFQQKFDTSFSNVLEINSKEFINTIDIPLNLVYKFKINDKLNFFAGAGPYFSFIYGGKLEKQTISKDTIEFENKLLYNTETSKDIPVGDAPGKYKVMDLGFNGIAGIEAGKIFLSAHYSRGLSNIFSPLAYTASDYKHEVIGLTFGIYLGSKIELEEKVRDKDRDGIPDQADLCPGEPGTEITRGCPDKDSDGIADKEDNCPDTPGTSANKGCPVLDKDNDGINDNDDKCPDIAGSSKYNGCPVPDSDNDGVNDEEDKCPAQHGFSRYGGCPIPDSDGDGVNDEEDKCPSVKGTIENNGCATQEIKQEIIEKVNYAARRIQFRYTQSSLLPASYKVLDEVVAILNQDPSLQLSIEGHTSTDGIPEANMQLSQQRAENVKNYLVSKGIAANRLTARGFGPTQPLNNGKTEAEKSLNRRVELKLSN